MVVFEVEGGEMGPEEFEPRSLSLPDSNPSSNTMPPLARLLAAAKNGAGGI